jgi:plastocyanin
MKQRFLLTSILATALFVSCDKNNDELAENIPAENIVRITSGGFSPSRLEVPINSTVTWKDEDQGSHTVTGDAGKFDSGVMLPNATYNYEFNTAGEYPYHCSNHAGETGIIVVNAIR